MNVLLRAFVFFLLIIISLFERVHAQITCEEGRYQQVVFSEFVRTNGILYGENIQPTTADPNNTQKLYFDFFEPKDDSLEARPLIILAFGGSFVFGSRQSPDIIDLCKRFAQMGYVTASIDYRLTPDLIFNPSTKLAYEAVLKGTHDMRAAVRFFYQDALNSNQFRVDTSKIFIGGVSAGAVAAVHLAYLDSVNEVPALIAGDLPNVGGLEGLSGNLGYSSDVAGVINLAGGILDTAWIDSGNVPIVSAHGTEDDVIPYGAGTISILNLSVPFHGSASIKVRMDSLEITNDLYSFAGAGHVPFSQPPGDSAFRDTAFQFVRDFLIDMVCDPVNASVDKPLISSLRMYPNPMRESVMLELPSPHLFELTFTDLSGREVNTRVEYQANGIRLWKGSLESGLYLVRVKHKQNGSLYIGKLVVE